MRSGEAGQIQQLSDAVIEIAAGLLAACTPPAGSFNDRIVAGHRHAGDVADMDMRVHEARREKLAPAVDANRVRPPRDGLWARPRRCAHRESARFVWAARVVCWGETTVTCSMSRSAARAGPPNATQRIAVARRARIPEFETSFHDRLRGGATGPASRRASGLCAIRPCKGSGTRPGWLRPGVHDWPGKFRLVCQGN